MGTPSISRHDFGQLPDGRKVTRFELSNGQGMRVEVIDYGACIKALELPDRSGNPGPVVLGYATLEDYLADTCFMGAVVGRYANRIADGDLPLEEQRYALPQNQGTNHLHGGPDGFYRALWQARTEVDSNHVSIVLSHRSPDGHAGYPGTLDLTVTYRVGLDATLAIDYLATTDRLTVVNPTQHAYFNLNGGGRIDDHELLLYCDHFTPVDERLIPTGEIRRVEGTPLDFRRPTRIGDRIDDPYEQLRLAGGYDHNFVVNGENGRLRPAARLHSPSSGRALDLSTTEPGIQFYSGNCLPEKGPFRYREGLCLETQHHPDSPHRPEFPSTIVRPGQQFTSRTVWRFSTV